MQPKSDQSLLAANRAVADFYWQGQVRLCRRVVTTRAASRSRGGDIERKTITDSVSRHVEQTVRRRRIRSRSTGDLLRRRLANAKALKSETGNCWRRGDEW